MLERRSGALGWIAVTLLLAGCSEVLGDGDGGLTPAEAIALAGQLGLESMSFAEGQGGAQAGLVVAESIAAVPETVNIDYAFTRPCPRGGSVASSGTIRATHDLEVPSSSVDIVASDEHQACVFLADGTRISLWGDPNVTTEVHVASEAGEPSGVQTVSVLGAVRWEADDDRSGRCALDVFVQVNPDAESQTVRGTICDHSFDVTVTNGS